MPNRQDADRDAKWHPVLRQGLGAIVLLKILWSLATVFPKFVVLWVGLVLGVLAAWLAFDLMIQAPLQWIARLGEPAPHQIGRSPK